MWIASLNVVDWAPRDDRGKTARPVMRPKCKKNRSKRAKARNTKAIGAGVGMAAVFIIRMALSSLVTAGFVILMLKLERGLP